MNDAISHLRQVGADPTVLRDERGRAVVVIDDAVLAPLRGFVPPDEPAVVLRELRPLRISLASRVRC